MLKCSLFKRAFYFYNTNMGFNLNKGQLLIAKPSILNDLSFNRTVIMLCEHNSNGTVGLILNKPMDINITDLVPQINTTHLIYNGGPVSMDSLYFIHLSPKLIPNSISIDGTLYWSGNFEVVIELLNSNQLSKKDIRFFLGYTGWDNNQLDQEIKTNSWLIKNNDYTNILSVTPEDFWRNELMKCGGVYQIWANSPKDPSLN